MLFFLPPFLPLQHATAPAPKISMCVVGRRVGKGGEGAAVSRGKGREAGRQVRLGLTAHHWAGCLR